LSKKKIDLLTAQSWFTDDKKLENQVIQESVSHSIPSQYTSFIAFETRQEDLEKKGLDNKSDENKEDTIVKSKKWAMLRNNKATIGAIAIAGTAIAVATTVATFGDVQSTFDNVPVLTGGFDFEFHDGCCGAGGCDECCCDPHCDDCNCDCPAGDCSIM